MLSRKFLIAAMTVAGLAAAGGVAVAQQGPFSQENDAIADVQALKVGLAQAIGVAEQSAGGRATRAEIERRNGAVVVEVEVVTPARAVMDVTVDANGRVLATSADAADRPENESGDGRDDDSQGGEDRKD